jgi:hypothetical protein
VGGTGGRRSLAPVQRALTWDRIGAAAGVIGVLLALAGLAATGGGGASRPGRDAATEQVVTYMSRPATATSFLGFALVLTGFFFLLLFFARLWAIIRKGEGEGGWLATAGLAGAGIYMLADITRFMFSDARNLAAGHHLAPAEGVTLFDISNALTPLAWMGIAMFMIPTSLAALRSRMLPTWLGWSGVVIGAANLFWAWLPPGGTSTPAEDLFIVWIFATSVVLIRRSMAPAARSTRSS